MVALRKAITVDVLDRGCSAASGLSAAVRAGEIGRNPDRRIQEDARHLCGLCAELGVGLLQSTLMLVSFVGACFGYCRRTSPWSSVTGGSRYSATWSGALLPTRWQDPGPRGG